MKQGEVRVLRVTSANRTSITPKSGELLWETDTETLYCGDGSTAGGVAVTGGGGGVTDHGLLTGLLDDDHTQYHNDTRGDARYYQQGQVDTLLAAKANVSQLPPSSYASVSNTDTTTNINVGTNFSTNVPLVGNYSDDGGSDFSQSGSTGVTCNFNGEVEISWNTHQIGDNTDRQAPRLRTKLDGTPVGPVGATGYIRDSGGHLESSCHVQTFRLTVTSGQVITFGSDQEAAGGAAAMAIAGSSTGYIKRVA